VNLLSVSRHVQGANFFAFISMEFPGDLLVEISTHGRDILITRLIFMERAEHE
jgi:hypothetical protein